MHLTDAHCHLQEEELAEIIPNWWPLAESLGIHRWLVNGLHEGDWAKVAEMARQQPGVIPSYGLHPWYVKDRSPQWLEILESFLASTERAGVGEIGLDKWVKDNDFPTQLEVFRQQLALSAKRNLPTSIHCIQAWGPLWDELRTSALPACGFLLHAYGGPVEMVPGFVKLGAYFSFSPYFLHERKFATREVFRHIPLDRILIETDAPALYPPPEHNHYPVTDSAGATINHPANLTASLQGLAKLRNIPEDELAYHLEQNFNRWWNQI